MTRLRTWCHRKLLLLSALLTFWLRLERYERRKLIAHGGIIAWLSHAVVREWHLVTELDLSFFILAVVIELEERTKGKVYAWPNRSNSTSYGAS